MTGLDLRALARALGGDIVGHQVNCPGPNHSRTDRSLGVRPSSSSPVGFVLNSYSGDDFASCRDFVLQKLGMPLDAWRTRASGTSHPAPTFTPREPELDPDRAARIARAVAIWNEAGPALGSIVVAYLSGRGLSLDLVDNVHEVIRFHPRTPWRDEEADRTVYAPCMIALMRSVTTDEPQAIHRTRFSPAGEKLGRRMLGIAAGGAVKVDSDYAVTGGLAIGEGIETVLAGRQLGFCPAWALASAGAVAGFPVLSGVECLTILGENDDANRRAVDACASRWHQADREVTVIKPARGSDILDAMRGAA